MTQCSALAAGLCRRGQQPRRSATRRCGARCEALARLPGSASSSRSPLYRTQPFGEVVQPAFVNAVAGLLTQSTPEELLAALRALERELGREAPRERWGPRVIDLDLLVVGPRRARHRNADAAARRDRRARLRALSTRGHRAGPRRPGPGPRRASCARASRIAASNACERAGDGNASVARLYPPQRYIVVEGPIGVGKTSLAHRLAETLEAELVLEQDAQNPFLERFYREPEVRRAAGAALLPVPARAAARHAQAAGPVRAAPRRRLSIREGPVVRGPHARRGRDGAVRAGGIAARGGSAEAGPRGLSAGAGRDAAAADRQARHRL